MKPNVAIEGQRPGDKPAQGKRVRRVRAVRPFYAGTSAALGLAFEKDKALKGRHTLSRPFRALILFAANPGRCPGLACGAPLALKS